MKFFHSHIKDFIAFYSIFSSFEKNNRHFLTLSPIGDNGARQLEPWSKKRVDSTENELKNKDWFLSVGFERLVSDRSFPQPVEISRVFL